MKKIVVATDGSEGSDRAVDFAAQLAKKLETGLSIVHVMGMGTFPEAVLVQFTRPQHAWLRESLTAHSATILAAARERTRAQGLTMVQLESRDGDTAQAILDFAEEVGSDLIVVGKRGSGRVAGLLLGSVSQKLASLSSKVVAVVP